MGVRAYHTLRTWMQVVEVVLHDPLYKWTLSYAKAHRVQPLRDADMTGNGAHLTNTGVRGGGGGPP
jgi:hypothetical protein